MDCGVPLCILGTSVILSLGGEVLERSEHEVEPFGSFQVQLSFLSGLIKIVSRTKMAAGLHDAFVSNDYSLAQRTPVVLRT